MVGITKEMVGMRKLTLILTTLIFSLMFSSTSFAEWKEVTENVNGRIFYVDFERIRKHGGYVYWWELNDYLKQTDGAWSVKIYKQADCKMFRYKDLSGSFHKEPMGGGDGKVSEPPEHLKGWIYPPPDTVAEFILKAVCQHAGM